jgi:transcriptional regulator with XRE-family HTH domain
LRKAQNLSQRKFALMIGINRTYLIDVEHGRRNVAFDNLMKIATGLGVSISELVADIEYKG